MTTVKYFHSGMAGAPQMTTTAGTMIAVLDACLVNGFSSQTVDSVSVSGSVATVTRAAGHPFGIDTVTEISGATPAGLNGQKRVLSASSTTYTFDAAGVPDGTATGTITHKVAAAGWEKAFSGTNLAAYRSLDVSSTQSYLRVDDTDSGGNDTARVVGYLSMSDINTGVDPFPTAAQLSGGGHWNRFNSGATAWTLVADTSAFFITVGINGDQTIQRGTWFFGDINSRKNPDPYRCLITASNTNSTSFTHSAGFSGDVGISAGNTSVFGWQSRSFAGLGTAKQIQFATPCPVNLNTVGTLMSGLFGAAYPNGPDNGLILTPVFVGEVSPNCWRGNMPGLFHSPQVLGTNFENRDRVTDVAGLVGRAVRAVRVGTGTYFIDVTGPWR